MLSNDPSVLADVRTSMPFVQIAVVFELVAPNMDVLEVAALFERQGVLRIISLLL